MTSKWEVDVLARQQGGLLSGGQTNERVMDRSLLCLVLPGHLRQWGCCGWLFLVGCTNSINQSSMVMAGEEGSW